MPTSNFPQTTRPGWSKNWLDGSDDWRRAFQDYQIFNLFVDEVNKRIRVVAALNGTAPSLISHAASGDYCNGGSPAAGHCNWRQLVSAVESLSSNFARGWNDPTTAATYYTTGTWLYQVDDAQPQVFFLYDYKPREIANTSASGSNGQLARHIGASSTYGTNTGKIFLYSSGAWAYSATNGLPDTITTAPATNSAFGHTIYDTDAGPNTGSYVTANFLQQLRDKINMLTCLVVGPLGSSTNGAYLDSTITNYFGRGFQNPGSAASTLADAQANYHTPPTGTEIILYGQIQTAGGAFVEVGDASPQWSVNIWHNATQFIIQNVPHAGLYACKVHFYSCCARCPTSGGFPTTFKTFGDPVTEGIPADGSGGVTNPFTINHFEASGILGTSTTSYTTAALGNHTNASTLTLTSPTNGIYGWSNGPDPFGFGGNVANFAIVDFGVAGGF